MHNFYKIPSINCILITGTYRHHLSPDATYILKKLAAHDRCIADASETTRHRARGKLEERWTLKPMHKIKINCIWKKSRPSHKKVNKLLLLLGILALLFITIVGYITKEEAVACWSCRTIYVYSWVWPYVMVIMEGSKLIRFQHNFGKLCFLSPLLIKMIGPRWQCQKMCCKNISINVHINFRCTNHSTNKNLSTNQKIKKGFVWKFMGNIYFKKTKEFMKFHN